MPVYELTDDQIRPLSDTTFAAEKINERGDLQRLLRNNVEVISPETLVIAEEFGDWEESRRRIDLLGIDKDANLVVIELKRTEDGGHMELQAIRYAAMVSAMTFENAVQAFDRYLRQSGKDADATESLLQFLEWDEPNEDDFAQDVRIVLASAEFSRELTTSVMWLNDHGVDICCMRIKPYRDQDRVLVDIQQIIPLPESEDYRVKLQEKQERARGARKSRRDYTKFKVTVGDTVYEMLPKRTAIYHVVKNLCDCGVSPEEINECVPWRGTMFCSADGDLKSDEFMATLYSTIMSGNIQRYFCDDDQLIHANGKTYALSNGWGNRASKAIEDIIKRFHEHSITCEKET